MQPDAPTSGVPEAITADSMLELLDLAEETVLNELDYCPEFDIPEQRAEMSELDLQEWVQAKVTYEDIVETFKTIRLAIERGKPIYTNNGHCPKCNTLPSKHDKRRIHFCDTCGQLIMLDIA